MIAPPDPLSKKAEILLQGHINDHLYQRLQETLGKQWS